MNGLHTVAIHFCQVLSPTRANPAHCDAPQGKRIGSFSVSKDTTIEAKEKAHGERLKSGLASTMSRLAQEKAHAAEVATGDADTQSRSGRYRCRLPGRLRPLA